MTSIALARAVHVLAYVEVLRRVGAPVEREMRRAGLPTLLDELADTYVPAIPALRFLEAIARSEAIEDLGLLATARGSFRRLRTDLQGSIRSAPTLWARLRRFGGLVAAENTNLRLSIAREGEVTRICLDMQDVPRMPGLQFSEWLQLDALIDTIRDSAGPHWSPLEITFQSHFALPRTAYERFPHVSLRVGCRRTSITVPSTLLAEPCGADGDQRSADGNAATVALAPEVLQPDFPRALKLALRPYLGAGYPDVRLAAEIAGLSPRTLQRRLLLLGLSYRALVQETRVEAAREILARPKATVLDAAYAVGYTDPSNFARAFRRVTGANPRSRRTARAPRKRSVEDA